MDLIEIKVFGLKIPEVKELAEELSYLRAFHQQVMYCFKNEIGDMRKELNEYWEADGLKVPKGY